jgi:phage FluMu protein Com
MALSTVTVSGASFFIRATATVAFTDVRCPKCQSLVMALPGATIVEVYIRLTNQDRTGRGPVVACRRCKHLVEAIPHR